MTWTLMKKEILEHVTTFRFLSLFSLLGLLIFVSIIVSISDYQIRMNNYELLRPKKGSPNVIISPPVASIFVRGLDANIGRLHEITPFGIDIRSNQQSVNRLFSLFVTPDMHFVIRIFVSLIAMLLSFDAISSEKETGTLRVLLASGVKRTSLFLGKLLGRYALTIVPFFVLFLIAATVVALLPSIQTNNDYWEMVTIMILVTAIYAFVFSSLGIFISCLVQRSSSALAMGLAMWVLFAFIIPNAGQTFATSMVRLPVAERVEMEGRMVLIRAIYQRIQRDPTTSSGKEGLAMIESITTENSRYSETYLAILDRLVSVTKSFSRISPSGSLMFLLTDVASTGVYEDLRLKKAILRHASRNHGRLIGTERGPVEDFSYVRATFREIVSESAIIDIIILILYAAGFVAFGGFRFHFYDPR